MAGSEYSKLRFIDVAHSVGNFFYARYFDALSFLYGLDEGGCFVEGIEGAGVKPGVTSAEEADGEFFLLEVDFVDVGDFEFSAGRWVKVAGDVDYFRSVEVEAGNGVVGFGVFWFFFDVEDVEMLVEVDDAIAMGVFDVVAEDETAGSEVGTFFEDGGQVVAVEDVVAEDEADGFVVDEGGAEDE